MREGRPERSLSGDGSGEGAALADASSMGMLVFVATLTMFFGASVITYLLVRYTHQPWPPPGFPILPRTLWLSTIAIIFTSLTMHGAVKAARKGDQVALRGNLALTLLLAVGFLLLQAYASWDIFWQLTNAQRDGTYLKWFYVMTGLHAAHVIGGLGPLVFINVRAIGGHYTRRNTSGIRAMAIYWHFLDVVWCVLFTLIYLV